MPHRVDWRGARRLRDYQRAEKTDKRRARREARLAAEISHLGHAVDVDPTVTGPAADPERVAGVK